MPTSTFALVPSRNQPVDRHHLENSRCQEWGYAPFRNLYLDKEEWTFPVLPRLLAISVPDVSSTHHESSIAICHGDCRSCFSVEFNLFLDKRYRHLSKYRSVETGGHRRNSINGFWIEKDFLATNNRLDTLKIVLKNCNRQASSASER